MKLGEPLVGQRAVASSWLSFAALASGTCVFILTEAHLGGTVRGPSQRGRGVTVIWGDDCSSFSGPFLKHYPPQGVFLLRKPGGVWC